MIDILSYVPWWLWAALALGAAAAIRVYTGSWRLALAVVTFGLALAFQSRAYTKGWNARETKGRADAAKETKRADRAAAAADRRNSDPKRLRESDGFKR